MGVQEIDPHEIAGPLYPVSTVLTLIVKNRAHGERRTSERGPRQSPVPYCIELSANDILGTVVDQAEEISLSVSIRY